MTDDFVARLRIRWDAMGDMANDERAAAAAEIESLRRGQREMMRTIATLTVERDEARRERDSARRMYCSEMAHDGNSPADVAEALGWDITRKEANV